MTNLMMTMHVVPSLEGGFTVQIIRPDQAVPMRVGRFETVAEAEAWVMQRLMTGGDGLDEPHILRPVTSLAVS